MKKLLYIAIIFIATSAGIMGCHDNDDLLSAYKRELSKTYSQTITVEEAKKQAEDFINDIIAQTRSNITKEIGDIYAWRKDQLYTLTRAESDYNSIPDTIMFIVNFKNDEGFILLSADRNKETVLAYIEDGYMSPYEDISNPGFKMFLDGVGDFLLFGDLLLDTIPDTTGIHNPFDPGFPLEPNPRIPSPLLSTKWHQNSPFNQECPVIEGDTAVAGCVPIATGQIFAYHRYPESYNGHTYYWDDILLGNVPQNNTGRQSVAYLIHDIGVIDHASYGVSGTSVSSNNVHLALDSMNYHYNFSSYSFDKCESNRNNHRPVLITGTLQNSNMGHAWVIDDTYKRYVTQTMNNGNGGTYQMTVTQKLVHCNWGWGGDCNGYFLSGVFDTQSMLFALHEWAPPVQGSHNYDLSYNLSIFYNVYPN